MLKILRRPLILVLIVGGALWFLAPRLFDQAANSLITSANASISQAQGLAQFVPASVNQTKQGNLQVKIDGLTPNTVYDVTLDQGQCGQMSMDLGTVNSDDNGSFYNEFALSSFKPDATWFVDIHEQNATGQTVACGQLETNSASGAQVISASNGGPNVFGGNSQSVPNDQGQTPTATPTTTTNTPTQPSGLPNTGVDPGNNQQYDNDTYPRKY